MIHVRHIKFNFDVSLIIKFNFNPFKLVETVHASLAETIHALYDIIIHGICLYGSSLLFDLSFVSIYN